MRPARSTAAIAVADGPPKWHWWLLLTVVIVEYLRPMDGLLKFLAPLRIGGITALIMVAVFVMSPKRYLREESLHTLMFAFTAVAGITVLFAPNNRAAFNTTISMLWLLGGFVLPITVILCNKQRLWRYFFFWMVVQTILAVLVALGGGHGPGSYLWDENDVALCLNMAIPYSLFLAQMPGITRARRLLLYGSAVILAGAVLVTASRGGVVGMAALVMILICLSKRPVRNGIIVAAVGALALVTALKLLPGAYVSDMESMNDPNDTTRDERLWSWSIGWVMYRENPILGVGAANYPWTNHLYAEKSPMYNPRRKILGGRQAHSLYFQLLPELGTTGALIFLGIIKAMYNRYRDIRNYRRSMTTPNEDAIKFELLFKAMLASCVTFLVTGAFISVLYYPPFWHLVGMVAASYRVAAHTLPDFAAAVKPLESRVQRRRRPQMNGS